MKILLSEKDINRFWSHVNIEGLDDCWEWTACKNEDNYGIFGMSNKRNIQIASRIAYIIKNPNTEINKKTQICHSCDNPPCCNPKHLWEGNAKLNRVDSVGKKRHYKTNGENHGRAKLTKEQVKDIRIRYNNGIRVVDLMRKFHISKSQVYRITHNILWKDDFND